MARLIQSSTSPSTQDAVQQIYTQDSAVRILSITFKARLSNATNFYIGSDSATTSSNGYELTPGESVTIDPSQVVNTVTGRATTIRPADLWAVAGSTVDMVDWLLLLED